MYASDATAISAIAGLEERLRNIEEGLTVHDDVLSATSYRSKGMARAGNVMTNVSYLLLFVQFCPWWLIMVCCAPKDGLPDGRYNPRAALATVVVDGGSAINALAVALYVHFGLGKTELLPIMVGYVVWFTGFTLLACVSVWDKYHAGTDWPAAQNAHNARLFRTFGIVVRTVTNDDVTFPLYFLVSLMPAFTAAFLVYWQSIPRFTMDCREEYAASSPGVLVGSCFTMVNNTMLENGNLCCKVIDERFDYFYFTGFLAGNIIAGYQAVKLGANCLLAHAEVKGFVTGGVASVATEDDPLRAHPKEKDSGTTGVAKAKQGDFGLRDFTAASQSMRDTLREEGGEGAQRQDGFAQRFNKAKQVMGNAKKIVGPLKSDSRGSLGLNLPPVRGELRRSDQHGEEVL